MNQRIIINVVALAVAFILAIFMGQWVVTAPMEVGIGFVVVMAIIVFFVLKQNIWVILPAATTLGISFPWMPGGFSPVELVSMYVIACTFFLLISRKVMLRLRFTLIEWMAVLVMLLLFQAYIRHPVGVRLMGSDHMGGRPYVVTLIALVAGIILASTRTDHEQIKKTFKLSIFAFIGTFFIQLGAAVSAKVAGYTAILFGVNGGHEGNSLPTDEIADPTKAGRDGAAGGISKVSARYLVAFYHPLKALYHPFWGILLLSALLGAGMSGFRNVIATTVFTLVMGTYYWGRGRAVFVGCLIGISGYVMINIINMMYPLPPNIQRSLSFLPGTWEERHILDAEGSTNWRVEIWEEALTTDRYIENKIIGDGLGIRRSDFAHIMAISESRLITDEMSQERAMLAGDYHSGPVSSIRVVGYVGLLVLITAMIVLAVRAHRLIMFSRGKTYFREVVFFCLPMVWAPIYFLFIFGDYKGMVPSMLVQMGLLRLLEINLKECWSEEVEQITGPT